MPFFKTTYNIFNDFGEHFDPNWMDSDKLILPERKNWDYKREMKLEDVELWEVVYQKGGGWGVYAAWLPYAEFYLIRPGFWNELRNGFETYYGPGAQQAVQRRMHELDMQFTTNKIWVEPEDMWLYANNSVDDKTIIV